MTSSRVVPIEMKTLAALYSLQLFSTEKIAWQCTKKEDNRFLSHQLWLRQKLIVTAFPLKPVIEVSSSHG